MPRAPIVGIVALAFGTAIAFATIYVVGSMADVIVEEGPTMENLKDASTLVLFLPVVYIGLRSLRLARTSFLPMGWSQDGEVRVEFAAPPRIGRTVEGRLWLKRKLQVGETFRIRMWCDRNEYLHIRGRDRVELDHVFFEEKESAAVGGEGAASLPFAFDVPADVPVSTSRFSGGPNRPRWFLELVVPKSLFRKGPEIDFDMGRAA